MLISILDAENINLLGDNALQEATARWRTQIDELDERAGQLAINEGEALLALGRYPQIGVVLAHAEDENSRSLSDLSGEVMRQAREDNELMAIAARKAFQGQIHLQTLRAQREQAAAVIGLIQVARNRM